MTAEKECFRTIALPAGFGHDALLSIECPPTVDDPESILDRVESCINACEPFDDPESEIPELIEGFFEGKGEPSRDESVYYLTVRDTVKKETATLIIADTSEGAAQRLIDCVNACEMLPDPAADVAEMLAILREIPLLFHVHACALGERLEKLLSKVEK